MDSPSAVPASTNWFKTAIAWFAAIFTEPDNNGGKASFSRVAGAYVVITIVNQSYHITTLGARLEPSAMLWDVFMVCVGYQLLSKSLNSISPAIVDFARGYMNKHTKDV